MTRSPLPLARRWLAVALAATSIALAHPKAHAQTSEEAPDTDAPPVVTVTPPRVLTHVDAVLPPSAAAPQAPTDVIVSLTVGDDGHAYHVEVTESGGPQADRAAIAAAEQWTFEPATRKGSPVAVRIKIPFHFGPPGAPVAAKPAPPEPPPSVVPPWTTPPPAASRGFGAGRIPALATAGLAVVSLGAGTVLGALALGDHQEFEKSPTTELANRGEARALAADMLFGGAATLAVASLVMFLSHDSAAAQSVARGPVLHF
jgi:protein TonB